MSAPVELVSPWEALAAAFDCQRIDMQALKDAIKEVGGQRALAAKLGKKQGHIGNWLHRDKKVPAEVCADIEAATGGKVTRQDLRPDVFREPPESGDPLPEQPRKRARVA